MQISDAHVHSTVCYTHAMHACSIYNNTKWLTLAIGTNPLYLCDFVKARWMWYSNHQCLVRHVDVPVADKSFGHTHKTTTVTLHELTRLTSNSYALLIDTSVAVFKVDAIFQWIFWALTLHVVHCEWNLSLRVKPSEHTIRSCRKNSIIHTIILCIVAYKVAVMW